MKKTSVTSLRRFLIERLDSFQILKGLPGIIGRPGESMPAFNFKRAEEELVKKFGKLRDVDVMSR